MKRALAVIMAVLVSIVWLGLIIGVPVLGATGQLERWIPDQLQQMIDEVETVAGTLIGILPADLQDLVPQAGIENEPEIVLVETSTPTPEPETPTPTPPLPTDTPTPEPTSSPVETPTPDPDLTVTEPLTGTGDITTTVNLTTTVDIGATGVQTATVIGIANLRSGPGTDFDSVGTVDADTEVSIVARDETGDWFQLEDGTWIFGILLAEAPTVPVAGATPPAIADVGTDPVEATPEAPGVEPLQTITTTVSSDANLRVGPGTTYNIVSGLSSGTVITLAARNVTGSWYLLDTGNWVSATLLAATPEGLPIVNEQGIVITGPNAGQSVLEEQTTPIVPVATEPAPVGVQPTTNAAANLRSGPGTTFNVVGSAAAGTVLNIVGRNAAGDWFRLSDGTWIFAALVNNPPANLPVATTP